MLATVHVLAKHSGNRPRHRQNFAAALVDFGSMVCICSAVPRTVDLCLADNIRTAASLGAEATQYVRTCSKVCRNHKSSRVNLPTGTLSRHALLLDSTLHWLATAWRRHPTRIVGKVCFLAR